MFKNFFFSSADNLSNQYKWDKARPQSWNSFEVIFPSVWLVFLNNCPSHKDFIFTPDCHYKRQLFVRAGIVHFTQSSTLILFCRMNVSFHKWCRLLVSSSLKAYVWLIFCLCPIKVILKPFYTLLFIRLQLVFKHCIQHSSPQTYLLATLPRRFQNVSAFISCLKKLSSYDHIWMTISSLWLRHESEVKKRRRRRQV